METLTKIYVPLNESERKALIQLGLTEKRDPRQQAAMLIHQSLERLGLIQPTTSKSEVKQNECQPANTWAAFYHALHREAEFLRELMQKAAAGTPRQDVTATAQSQVTRATRPVDSTKVGVK